MFMGDCGHIRTVVKCKLLNNVALTTELHCGISRVKVLAIYVSHGARHSDSCGNWHLLHTAMLSRCCLIVCHYWST